MSFLETMKKIGLDVKEEFPTGYRIRSKSGKSLFITFDLIFSIGTMQKEWHHTEDCWTNYADYVPFPPNCDCPVEELGLITEENIINMIYSYFRDEVQSSSGKVRK